MHASNIPIFDIYIYTYKHTNQSENSQYSKIVLMQGYVFIFIVECKNMKKTFMLLL